MSTKKQKEKAVERAWNSFVTVVESLNRLQKYKSPGRLKELPDLEVLYQIRRPDGRGVEIIGRQGAKGFRKAAEAFFDFHSDYRGRITKKEIIEVLKPLFSREVIRKRKAVDLCLSERILRTTHRYVRRHLLRTTTHFLPCVITSVETDELVQIGPVRLLPTESFFREYESAIDDYARSTERHWIERERLRILGQAPTCRPNRNKKWPLKSIRDNVQLWLKDFKDIFESYPWVAVVEINSCAREMSQKRAVLAVETALNALRLLFGADHARGARLGGGFRLETKSATATMTSDGELRLQFVRKWEDSSLPDDWPKLVQDRGFHVIGPVGSLISPIATGHVLPPLYQRIIDSLSWYGEAVSEPQPHTRILRCMACLERLLVTPGRGASRMKVIDRGALLSCINNPSKLQNWRERVSRLYKVRNDIVHGSLSPFDQKVLACVATADRVAQRCLLGGLYWAGHLAQRNPFISAGELHWRYETELEQFCFGEAHKASSPPSEE